LITRTRTNDEYTTVSVADYLARNRERHVAELGDFVRFPSISTLPAHEPDLRVCAEWLASHLESIGLEHAGLHDPGGHPIVYADWLHAGPEAPTVLVYGHYDVQPVEPLELWDSPPFEPTLRGGRLYARGASDNKGQIFANVKALEALLAVDGKLPCNVKLIVEGEEELRADHIAQWVEQERTLLAADLVVISDVTLYARGVPGLPLGLRGMAAVELMLRTADGDLHSGLYGGAVPNALHALARLVDTLHGENGGVAVEGFYDRVRDVDPAEREAWRALPFDELVFAREAGATELHGERGYTTLERLWARPTLDLHGAWGGFAQAEGFKTIVPADAHATLSCRLVPDMRPDETIERVVAHLQRHTPPGATLTIESTLEGSWPIVTPRDDPAVDAALAALEDGFGREPVVFRMGWSVPAAEILKRSLGVDVLLLGFALSDENAHAPNENYDLENYAAGIRTMASFWPRLAAAPFTARSASRTR
jgi:acetylornithine deacetylase/succinyl-diaminopimelate desuccinylase-like protein